MNKKSYRIYAAIFEHNSIKKYCSNLDVTYNFKEYSLIGKIGSFKLHISSSSLDALVIT